MEQEAERAAGGERGEHGRRADAEVERDHRERDAVDRADPGGKAVDPVGEVDDVHQRDEPDDGQHAALVRKLQSTDERQRHVGDDDAALDRDDRRRDLAEQLPVRPQGVHVVDRTDQRDQARPEHDRPRVRRPTGSPRSVGDVLEPDHVRHPDRRRQQHAGEDRQPAQHRCLRSASPRSLGWTTAPSRTASRAANGVSKRGHDRRYEEREYGIPVTHTSTKDASRAGLQRI